MKGVVLAGGMGTRLGLFAQRVANKHAALVYDRPMIEYPLSLLSQAGIEEIAVVVSSHQGKDIMHIIGDGYEFGFNNVQYFVQHTASGIAGALKLTKSFVGDDNFCVILGDNFFDHNMTKIFESFKGGCQILLKEVADPKRFGVAEVKDGRVLSLEEKPANPKSNLAVTGLYLFDKKAFEYAETLKPSARGELEIVDIIRAYLEVGLLKYEIFDGFWSDMGTPKSLLRTALYLIDNDHSLKSSGRFSKYRFKLKNGEYGDYLAE